jgi:hypothetical protein
MLINKSNLDDILHKFKIKTLNYVFIDNSFIWHSSAVYINFVYDKYNFTSETGRIRQRESKSYLEYLGLDYIYLDFVSNLMDNIYVNQQSQID